MPTNINYKTLDAIQEEKPNFKINQKVVTNKLFLWKYCLLAKLNQFPKVLVLLQIVIGYEYFKIVHCMVGKWFEIKNPITDLLTMELPNMSQVNIDGNRNVTYFFNYNKFFEESLIRNPHGNNAEKDV